MRIAVALGMAVCAAAQGQTPAPDLLKNARIALRLNTGQLPIVGGGLSRRVGTEYGIYDRSMDRIFLTNAQIRYEAHLLRWRLPGGMPLLLAEVVWKDEKGIVIFGATAVTEEASALRLLDFDPRIGVLTRIPEIANEGGWQYPESGVFLNAWAIGGRRLVLRTLRGYEGFSVELPELVPGKGFVPTSLSFGAGC